MLLCSFQTSETDERKDTRIKESREDYQKGNLFSENDVAVKIDS